jgi:formylglycine-generating enzyme required for sulfatase activity
MKRWLLSAVPVLASALAFAQTAAPPPPASAPSVVPKSYPLWDGKESVADYARRAGIPDVALTLDLGTTFLDQGSEAVTLKLTLIPAGKFMMGSPESDLTRNPDEMPQREVTLTRPFYMGVHEVTRGQYQRIVGKNPKDPVTFEDRNKAVTFLTWPESLKFCEKASAKTGWKITLPTEAQWEYACRAGSTTRSFFGDNQGPLDEYAWINRPTALGPADVGTKKPNPWGLYDIYGNALEWCWDFYGSNYYQNADTIDPKGPATGSDHVVRGTSSAKPRAVRSAQRAYKSSYHHYPHYGFRVVAEIDSLSRPAAAPAKAMAPAPSIDGHLHGVVLFPANQMVGVFDTVRATLERLTSLRFQPFQYGRIDHGTDLQWWAKSFLTDLDLDRQKEWKRLLDDKPAFVLVITGKGTRPAWVDEALAAYTSAGGRVIEEAALADLPSEKAQSSSKDSTHLWARAWENALRSACQPSWISARIAAPAAALAGDSLPVKVSLSAAAGGPLTLALEDRSGKTCQSTALPAPAELKAEAALALSADLPAGTYHLAVRGADREYGCQYVTVTQSVALKLTGDSQRQGQGGTATVTASLTAATNATAGDYALQWVLRDYRRGVIDFRQEKVALAPGATLEKTFPVALLDTDTKAWVYWVQATLTRNGRPIATAEERAYRWRPFTMREDLVFGTWHVKSDDRPEGSRPLVAAYLRAMGMRSSLEEASEVFQRAGMRATTEHRKMTAVSFTDANPTNMTANWLQDGRKGFGRNFDSPSFAVWSLGEETGFNGNWSEAYPWRDKEQGPEYAAFWFREYLKKRYASLEALNASWKSAFKDWKEIQYLRKYAYPYGWLFVKPSKEVEKNLAPYVDTHAFAEWYVHNQVTSTVAGLREVNPVPAWTKSYEFTFLDGADAPITHFLAATDPHGTAMWNAYIRRQTPGAPPCFHLNWGFFDDRRQMLQFWLLGVLSGATYIDNWGPAMNWDFTYTTAGVELRDLAKQLEPAANLILQARMVEDTRVGIFLEETPWKLAHGRPGYFLKGRAADAATYGPTIQSPPGASWLASAEGPLYSALTDAGYSPCYLKRDEIAKAKIIYLPYTEALSLESATALKAFVNQGGILVALPRLAEYDEGGHPFESLPGAGMQELFGLTLEDSWVGRQSIVTLPGPNDAAKVWIENWQIGQALPPEQKAEILSFNSPSSYAGQPVRLIADTHQAVKSVAEGTKVLSKHEDGVPALTYRKTGKGAAIFLNVYRGWPPNLHVPADEGDVAFARALATLAAYAGVEPDAWFETLDSNGTFAPELAHFNYTSPKGLVRLRAVYNDWRSPDVEARFLINTNLPVAAVYDVLTGERLALRSHLGRPCAFVSVPRGTGRLLAILPYEVTAVTLKAARTQVQAGEPVELTATVAVAQGPADEHPGELTVFGPDGQPVKDAARHVILNGTPIRVPTYLDLPAGDYRFVVQDGATRKSASCTVRVTANPVAAGLPAEAPFGWPSWTQTRIDVGPAEFETLLKDLAALYNSQPVNAYVAFSFYIAERAQGRQRLGQLLAHADWTKQADVLRRMLTRGDRIVLVGEDLGLDPIAGVPSVPLTQPTALAVLGHLAAEGKVSAVRGLPDVLVLQLGKGALVIDRSSPDREAGSGPTRMNAWITAWQNRMREAGLLAGGQPDANRLAPTAPGLDLQDWFLKKL